MKKRTVITTEKHEVWVVREAIPEPAKDQTIDISNAIEVPPADIDLQEPDEFDKEQKK